MNLLLEIAAYIQQCILRAARRLPEHPVRVVCIADTHSQLVAIPTGDILVHAGDLSRNGTFQEIQDAITWLDAQPHTFKIVIGGNADLALEQRGSKPARAAINWGNVVYLDGEAIRVKITRPDGRERDLNIFGDGHVPRSADDPIEAFQYEHGTDYWRDAIPGKVDILITHTPPKYILDDWGGVAEGCPSLLQEIKRQRPSLHVFGHVHPAHGQELVVWSRLDQKTSIREQWDTGASILQSILSVFILLTSTPFLMMSFFSRRQIQCTRLVNAACASSDGNYMKHGATVTDI